MFGFHLCGLDMRQNSAVHEEVVGELLAWAGVCDDYAALDEAARVELLAGELTMRRPLVRPDAELSETARGELDVLLAAAEQVALLGPRTIPNYVISMCESVSDVLEVAVLLKEVGLLDPGADGGPTCSVGISPLFETIDDLQAAGTTLDRRCSTSRCTASLVGRPRRRAGGHARLLRQQQGRRLPRRQLGAVPGRARPGRGRPRARASGCGCSTAAAAPSAAAAAPATRRSGRSRRARSPGRCGSPSRAR